MQRYTLISSSSSFVFFSFLVICLCIERASEYGWPTCHANTIYTRFTHTHTTKVSPPLPSHRSLRRTVQNRTELSDIIVTFRQRKNLQNCMRHEFSVEPKLDLSHSRPSYCLSQQHSLDFVNTKKNRPPTTPQSQLTKHIINATHKYVGEEEKDVSFYWLLL